MAEPSAPRGQIGVLQARLNRTFQRFARQADATTGLGNLSGFIFPLVAAIVLPVVGLLLLNALAPVYFDSFTGFIATLGNVTTGSETGDAFVGITLLIVSILGPIAFLGVAIAVIVIKVRGAKGT